MITKRVAVIGSRETPDFELKLTKAFVNILVECGYAIYSGGCPKGMDKAALEGAYKHKTSDKSKNRIYIPWQGSAGLKHNPAMGIYDATAFDNHDVAVIMATLARGSFEGLNEWGQKLHARNPYQVMGDDLATAVDFVLCYAKPTGKGGHVKGGTGTAVRIAIEHGIKVYNLYYQDVRERVEEIVLNVRLHQRDKAKKETRNVA
jgi:hypothetical protein